MSCRDIQPELVAYHFGVVSESTRSDVERHLLGCTDCVAELLMLKRAVETGSSEERPSQRARERLRAAVARKLHPEAAARPWIWWERPLAACVAAAAVAGALFAVQTMASSEGSPPRLLSLEPPPGLEAAPSGERR
jgi:anti-sigma factor RsiW